MNFKQLFCDHIWKKEKEEMLRETKELYSYGDHGTIYVDFRYYAEYRRCVKCDKVEIIEKKKVLI